MSNIKTIDFSGKPFTSESITELAGYEVIDQYIQEGYRHFVLDFRNIEYGNIEGFQHLGMQLISSHASVMGLNGKCIIIRPTGMMEMFGKILEKMMPEGTWVFVDSPEEANALAAY